MKAILWREYRTLVSSPVSVAMHLATPLFLLLFFATVLSRNFQTVTFNGRSVNYIQFFAPGLIGYITFLTFQLSLTFVRHDRSSGMLGIHVLAQARTSQYLLGKTAAHTAINLVKCSAILALALAIAPSGVTLGSLANAGVMTISIVEGTVTWLGLSIALALLLRRDDLRELVVLLISMPITFASRMYYDVTRAPIAIRAIAAVNPLTYITNLARQAYLGSCDRAIAGDLLILTLMCFAACLLSRFVMARAEF